MNLLLLLPVSTNEHVNANKFVKVSEPQNQVYTLLCGAEINQQTTTSTTDHLSICDVTGW